MGLISHQFDGLYGGVNQQSAEQRLNTQVEEMVNAVPTLDRGLLKRNPTQKLELSTSSTFTHDMYSYAYDRGLSGSTEEKYSINILPSGIEIIDVINGTVYNATTGGLTYTGNALNYITGGTGSPNFGGSTGYAATTIKDTTFITNKMVSPGVTVGTPVDTYLTEGYIWFKSANSANPYVYTVTVTDSLGNVAIAQSDRTGYPSATTTTKAAINIYTDLNTNANFSATISGSVVKVIALNGTIVTIDTSDSYGDQASFGWGHTVQFSTELPKSLGFAGSIVKVVGSGTNQFASYWLTYKEGQWQEAKDPMFVNSIDIDTMPHVLVRGTSGFTLSAYSEWASALVGDSVSNPLPSFLEGDNTIRDIFFFKNRLGFITKRTAVLSEVGEYGNFFRTTAAVILDSDYIDATVDTTEVVSLEYATYLEDSIMLFSDKAQFKLEGGKILSPKDVQISQTSAYEINTNIRPLFMNNKIFFCAIRGEYTAVMQYEVKSANTNSEAVDISAHVQMYIPNTISRLSGSPINNMLFLTSHVADDTVWVYKYYDNGPERVQSAWFKWTYNGTIYNAFSLGVNLNILINRTDGSTGGVDQFETAPIFPQAYTDEFLDDFTTEGNETIIPTVVKIGEWVPGGKSGKDIRGHLKFKTVQISSEDDSKFNLVIEDVARETVRTIDSKYTVSRKPMVYGDAKNIRISITNSSTTGFRINTVSYEGALTKRDSRR